MTKATLKLMPDYGCFPLWWGGERTGNVDPLDLPLSPDLRLALRKWAQAYDRTLNQDYPPESRFRSHEEAESFEVEGRRLWRELQAQIGTEYVVVYYSYRDRRLYQ